MVNSTEEEVIEVEINSKLQIPIRIAKAPSANLQVVAAKVPRVCIIRAFSIDFNKDVKHMIEEILPYVGSMNPDIEWTQYRYEGRPYYWHSVVGISAYGGGVYRWDYSGDGYKGSDSNTYREFKGLLHRPIGWAEIK